MATLKSVRSEVEEMCTAAGIPDQLKSEYDKFWQTVHVALNELETSIEEYLGE
jgi:hypothetical protein